MTEKTRDVACMEAVKEFIRSGKSLQPEDFSRESLLLIFLIHRKKNNLNEPATRRLEILLRDNNEKAVNLTRLWAGRKISYQQLITQLSI